MESVEIGHAGTLTFERLKRWANGTIDSVLVTVDLQGLRASQRVVAVNEFCDLVAFFKNMSAQWRGWKEPLLYESLEGDLRINATHDGHVRLELDISQTSVPGGWRMSGELVLDSGDELSNSAKQIESFFASIKSATMPRMTA